MYSLLNQHPQMALMYECDVWGFPESLSRERFKRNWLERQEFVNRALSRHRLIFGGSACGLERVRTPEELYRTFSDGKGASLWGEKSPLYCARLRHLARTYPGCSFILLWRDPVEIYRSVSHAGRKARFFRRSGMLNRLIWHQEQMLRQAARLRRDGLRVHHVTYADLIDNTENVCRGVCQFLGIEFDEKMLDLSSADFSAIYRAPQHDHLRRGVIERRQHSEEVMDARTVQKLQRYRARWNRLKSEWLGIQNNGAPEPEPSVAERLVHEVAGSWLRAMDAGKRALIEFLPLPWLRTYRLMKKWFLAGRVELPAERLTLSEQFSAHRITILASGAILSTVALLDFYSSPNLTFAPFYFMPPALLTLIISRRWGTFAAAIAAVLWSTLQISAGRLLVEFDVVVWNSAMRFLLFQIMIVLLDRVRVEIASVGSSNT